MGRYRRTYLSWDRISPREILSSPSCRHPNPGPHPNPKPQTAPNTPAPTPTPSTTVALLQEVMGQRDRSIVELQQKEQQQAQELAAAQAAEAAAARELALQQQQKAAAAASGAPGAAAAAATAAPVVVADGLHAAPSAQRAPAFSISNESGGGARASAAPRASGLTHLTTDSLVGLSGDAAREVQEVVARLGASEHRLALTDTALRVHDAQLESQPPNPARTPSPNPNPNLTPPPLDQTRDAQLVEMRAAASQARAARATPPHTILALHPTHYTRTTPHTLYSHYTPHTTLALQPLATLCLPSLTTPSPILPLTTPSLILPRRPRRRRLASRTTS